MQREKVEQLISILKLDKDGKLHRTSYGEVVIEKSFFFRADNDDLEIVRDIIKIMMDIIAVLRVSVSLHPCSSQELENFKKVYLSKHDHQGLRLCIHTQYTGEISENIQPF